MTEKDPEGSVHEEQFDAEEKVIESAEKTVDELAVSDQPADEAGSDHEDATPEEAAEAEDNSPAEGKPADEEPAEGKSVVGEPAEDDAATEEPVAEDDAATEEPVAEDDAATGEPVAEDDTATGEPAEEKPADEESMQEKEDAVEGESPSAEEQVNYDEIDLPPVDYSGFSRKELVETLALIAENRPPSEIVDDVTRIKELFYKKTKAEFNEKRLNFAKEGGNIDEYRPEPDELENRIKVILEKYRSRRSDFNRVQESEKLENLHRKLSIIEQIKDLVNREEAINKTFQEFRNLQNEWHSTGIVPQSALKDLWENYHHSVEIFYDYIKINRELRDLDLKKNLEVKIVLCEKAEELLMEPNAVTAFKLLQDYHNEWREIGPVPHESKDDVWERFREATSKVNKRHHEFFETQKDEQKTNLDAKVALCEKVEVIAASEILTFADFREKSDAIMECQRLWRTIGFAPKKHNNKIYQRFRTACYRRAQTGRRLRICSSGCRKSGKR